MESVTFIHSYDYSSTSRYYQKERREANDTDGTSTSAKRNLSNTSSTSKRTTYSASIKNRYSKLNFKESRHSLAKVPSIMVKKRQSKDKLEGYPPTLTSNKPKQLLTELSPKLDSESIAVLREDCHKIETVFLNCGQVDEVITKNNLKVLNNLHHLIACGGGVAWKPRENVVRHITHYLCKNQFLLSQLVYIMTDSQDLGTCICAIKILHELLVRGYRLDRDDRKAMIIALSFPTIFETLIESMYFIDLRFLEDVHYLSVLPKMHLQILEIILIICKFKESQKQLVHASENTVRLIGKLTSTYWRNRNLAISLLDTLKIITVKQTNCEYLESEEFFDGLCYCCQSTNKVFISTKILGAMSRNKAARECMSKNQNVIQLILELLVSNGKNAIQKESLFTTLYRIVSTENGFKFFSSGEIYAKLYKHFIKNEKEITVSEKIKLFSILNRIGIVQIFPIKKLCRGISLPAKVKQLLDLQNALNKSRTINDSDEETTDDEIGDINVSESIAMEYEIKLSEMSPFFVEQLLSTGKKKSPSNKYAFNLYEGIVDIFSTQIIETRIHRAAKINILAYPDAVMLEPEFDDHTFNITVNNYSTKKLLRRLKCLEGIQDDEFSSQIVYDLDKIQEEPVVSHPSTFTYNPKKIDDRPEESRGPLHFESRFESGNLRRAIQIGKYEYELHLNPDTNTTSGFKWFYFQVTNMVPKVSYTFNITTLLGIDSQFNYGMQPVMFSVIEHTLTKTGWKRVGKEIIYYGNSYINENGSKQYRTLSFQVSFVYCNDYVYFAYHYPYTYTRLMLKLYPLIQQTSKEIYLRVDRLCKTINDKNEIALLTITGAWHREGSLEIPLAKRPIIFITGRVHPGETNSSWIVEGIIKFLLKESDANAIKAREHFIFKIIPMLNPEGVIYGNNRTGLSGEDLNRCWIKPHNIICPEIYHTKRLIACAKKVLKLPIAAYIDIHGHSNKKFFFLYGCNPLESWNKKDRAEGDFKEILKIIPEMVHNTNPNISLVQCKNTIRKRREPTARVVMWREFEIKHSYTLECSLSFANEIQAISTKVLSNIGASIVSALGRIADKVYATGKSIPSLFLDATNMNNPKKQN